MDPKLAEFIVLWCWAPRWKRRAVALYLEWAALENVGWRWYFFHRN